MPVGTVPAIANAAMELLTFLNEAQRNHLSKVHKEAIEYMNWAKNAQYPNYATDRRTIAKEKLEAFELAYHLAAIDRMKELLK